MKSCHYKAADIDGSGMETPSFDLLGWSFDSETGIGRVILDRPEKLNALSAQLRREFVEGFEALQSIDAEAAEPPVRAVIVEGAGDRAFCAGADTTEFDDREPVLFDRASDVYQVCRRFPAPVVAKIDGYCIGGGVVLSVSCDFRLASERSMFGLPEVEHGIVPGGGFIRQLVGLVGVSRAKELLMTGSQFPAARAHDDGLVDHLYSHDDLDGAAEEFVDEFIDADPSTLRVIKDVANMSAGFDAERLYEERTTQWNRGGDWFSG